MSRTSDTDFEAQWPQLLLQLVDVLEDELKRQPAKQSPRQLARELAAALSQYMGGRSYYLPNGRALFNFLRDDRIFREYDGKNMAQLMRRHHLSQTQFYRIIARQRKLNRCEHPSQRSSNNNKEAL